MSINMHFIAQQTDKVYQRAIMMSGAALLPVLPGLSNHQSVIEYLGNLSTILIQNWY